MRGLVQLPEDAAFSTATHVRVLYADTDRMGVVYHGTYLRFLEQGRVEWLRSTGYPYAKMEREGFGLPVTSVGANYRQSALYDDLVTVQVALLKHTRVRVHFGYRLIVEPSGREGLGQPLTLVEATTEHACISMDTLRPVALPDAVADAVRTRARATA